MARQSSGRKPDKLVIQWWDSLVELFMQLLLISMGRGSAIGIISLFWNFTSVLWAPQNWIYWLQWILMSGIDGVYVDIYPLVSNPTPPCMSYEEKKMAVQADAADVSGWYGPGAYLAWLFTLYVSCMSTIWRSGSKDAEDSTADDAAEENKGGDGDAIDGEFLAALTYPAIAMLDILYRFCRCKVDPTLDAALLVMLTGIFTLGVGRRLASMPNLDELIDGDGGKMLPATPKQWILSMFLIIGHSLILAMIGEPYLSLALTVTLYTLAFTNMIYCTFKIERIMDRYPYRGDVGRPRTQRLVVFVLFQIILMTVLGTTQHSIFPRTGASLLDMDQCATFVTVIIATLFARRERILDFVVSMRRQLAGFRPVLSDNP